MLFRYTPWRLFEERIVENRGQWSVSCPGHIPPPSHNGEMSWLRDWVAPDVVSTQMLK